MIAIRKIVIAEFSNVVKVNHNRCPAPPAGYVQIATDYSGFRASTRTTLSSAQRVFHSQPNQLLQQTCKSLWRLQGFVNVDTEFHWLAEHGEGGDHHCAHQDGPRHEGYPDCTHTGLGAEVQVLAANWSRLAKMKSDEERILFLACKYGQDIAESQEFG